MTSNVQSLEPRLAFVAAGPTGLEQLLVELVNRARANPAAEAARFGIDLNEGLAPGTIPPGSTQPLAIHPDITDAARAHSQWMIDNNVFSHTGADGSTPGDRMTTAGYAFTPPWSWGENIAWRGSKPSVPDPIASTARIHQDLFVDANYPGRGHRVNLLKDSFKEIGTGVATGEFNTYNAVMVTEDFAYSGGGSFLTGVAYTDALTDDNFYTVGEGIGGVAITARRVSDGAVYSTETWSTGGYALQLPAGTYDVTGAGGTLGGAVRYGAVAIGAQNVKRDFLPPPLVPASVVGRFAFYNQSGFDGGSAAANAADDNAIATDKLALRPGQTATTANYTSYTRGINGIMVDIANPRADLSAVDFTLQTTTDGTTFVTAPAPVAIVRRVGAGVNGSDRFTLIFSGGAIVNRWLRVTVKPTAATGLSAADVFSFGNLAGDSATASPARIDGLDIRLTRSNLGRTGQPATSRLDFNRDGRINTLDLAAARRARGRTLTFIIP